MTTKELEKTKENKVIQEEKKSNLVITPRVDAYTNDKEIYLEVELPGVEKDSLEVNLEKSILSIRGERELTGLQEYELQYAEFGASEYYREFRIEDSVDSNNIKAVFQSGLLKVTIPFTKTLIKKVKIQQS